VRENYDAEIRTQNQRAASVSRLKVCCTNAAASYTNSESGCAARRFGGPNSLYLKPKTLDEAVSLLASPGGQVLAGGTDFYPALGERLPQGRVVDITALGEIRGISTEPEWIRIGGLTTWSDVIRAPLPRCFDALKAAAREVGSVQIQNRGTVAGNLCNASPAADGVPPLLALDAEVELASAAGRRRMPLDQFLAGNRKTLRRPDEILAAVLVPRRIEDAASAFLKLGARRYLVISISMVAAVVQAEEAGLVAEAHIAVGSCSATARRLKDLERCLVGVPAKAGIGGAVQAEHLRILSPIDDVRATAEYRRDASLTLVRRALEACVRGL
jgi:CO/xanthine dehydrogenase FAD-binding subunit